MVATLKNICEIVLSQEVGVPILGVICIAYLIANYLPNKDETKKKEKRKKAVRTIDNIVWCYFLCLLVAVIVVIHGGETIDVTLFGKGKFIVLLPINIASWFV